MNNPTPGPSESRPTGRPMKTPTNTLSATLRDLRGERGLSQAEAAQQSGLSQSKISRIETGELAPAPDGVKELCRVYHAPADVRRKLVQMALELREDRISARVVLERGGWALQERIRRLEEIAGRLRCIAPTVVPGMLQIEQYIIALFGNALSANDLARTVDARLARHPLLDTERSFEYVLTEGALRWNMGGAAVMVQQIEHLIEVSKRDNVTLGIVPWTTPVSLPLMHTVDIYDSRAVMFGTIDATALITDPAKVKTYEEHWDELVGAGPQPVGKAANASEAGFVTYGDAARAELTRIADDYRRIV